MFQFVKELTWHTSLTDAIPESHAVLRDLRYFSNGGDWQPCSLVMISVDLLLFKYRTTPIYFESLTSQVWVTTWFGINKITWHVDHRFVFLKLYLKIIFILINSPVPMLLRTIRSIIYCKIIHLRLIVDFKILTNWNLTLNDEINIMASGKTNVYIALRANPASTERPAKFRLLCSHTGPYFVG